MPRIDRHTTTFESGGRHFSAHMVHEHYDPPREFPGKYKPLKIIHKTICELMAVANNTLTTPVEVTGEALCSAHENRYRWQKGNKLALLRAMEQLNLTREGQGKFLQAFYTENKKKEYVNGAN